MKNKQTIKNTNYNATDELLDSEILNKYNYFIVKKSLEITNLKDIKHVIDFGAGIGTLSLIFRNNFNINPTCVEVDKKNINYLKKKLHCHK